MIGYVLDADNETFFEVDAEKYYRCLVHRLVDPMVLDPMKHRLMPSSVFYDTLVRERVYYCGGHLGDGETIAVYGPIEIVGPKLDMLDMAVRLFKLLRRCGQ